jgi:hypothetical protein
MGTHESSSEAVQVATCMVPQLRPIDALVISHRLWKGKADSSKLAYNYIGH